MGCLLWLFECMVDAILDGWMYLMQQIVPRKKLGKGVRFALTIIVDIWTVLLLFCMIIGVIALLFGDAYTAYIGRYLLFIPLGISAVQITVGAVMRHIAKRK